MSREQRYLAYIYNPQLINGGLIEGKVAENKPRRSPIPSGGQDTGDQSYFQRASTDKSKVLLRDAYNYEFASKVLKKYDPKMKKDLKKTHLIFRFCY